jgi:hypothetical protein
MNRRAVLALACMVAVLCASGCARKPKIWSVGIYEGSGPIRMSPAAEARNPVLSADNVTGVEAEFVADPFLLREGSRWHLFVEVMNRKTGRGAIGLATSDDGFAWAWRRIVLDEPFHLSYPCVFRADNAIYMTPETLGADAIRLYRAEPFPDKWVFVATLVKGKFADPTVFEHGRRWWVFASSNYNATLHLFGAERVTGPWTEHPKSPVVKGDPHTARPGGRVTVVDGHPVRFAQDDKPDYGVKVRAFEIMKLTTTEYEEREVAGGPVLEASGRGWNASGMHQFDPERLDDGRWIAAVDGFRHREDKP